MSKHTPGPWEVDGSAKTVRAGIGVSVAFCGESGVFGADGFQSIGTAEARANARLIASAPDLLEALKIMTAHYCNLVRSGDAGNWEPDAEQEVMTAKAAIAKATGND